MLPSLHAVTMGLAAMVALPLLVIAGSVLQPSTETLAHLARTILPGLLVNTVVVGAAVVIGTLLVGGGAAVLVAMTRFPGRRAFEWLLLLPLAMPAYIIGYAYTDALTFAGPVQAAVRDIFGWRRGDYWFPDVHGLPGVCVMLVLVLYPYVYVLGRAALLRQSRALHEAAFVMGRDPRAILWRVVLPMTRPALAAGAALVLMEALADFATVQYFGVDTFTTAIVRAWLGMGDRLAALQLSFGLLALVLAVLAVERWQRAEAAYVPVSRRDTPVPLLELRGWQGWLAAAACAVPVLGGFLIPVLLLLRLHLQVGDPLFGVAFMQLALRSLGLAALASVLILAAAYALALLARRSRKAFDRGVVTFATAGYAIPGTVIAVGVLVPLGAADAAINAAAQLLAGASVGLVLSGTIVALLYAYLVRFLAIGHGAVAAGFERVAPSLDHAARLLGQGDGSIARRIHWPLLRPAVISGAIIVFVDVLKELPATLIVRPFDFDTLAIRVYNLASDERLAQASTAALTLVLVGLIPVILLTRTMAAEGSLADPKAMLGNATASGR